MIHDVHVLHERNKMCKVVLLTCSLFQYFTGAGLGLHMTTVTQRPQQEQKRKYNHLKKGAFSCWIMCQDVEHLVSCRDN